MTDDITTRLREAAERFPPCKHGMSYEGRLFRDALAAIEQRDAEIARLKTALSAIDYVGIELRDAENAVLRAERDRLLDEVREMRMKVSAWCDRIDAVLCALAPEEPQARR